MSRQDYIELGQAPANECFAQVGQPGYRDQAIRECQAYIQAIRNYLGREPEGASLSYRGFPHDFGVYYEVVCYYDEGDPEATAYAFHCEAKAPLTWADGGVQPPTAQRARGRAR